MLVVIRLAFLAAFLISINVFAADEPRLNEETLSGLELRNLGPALMSGRIADIVVHPERRGTWYVAVGSGNVWKTVNAGTTWEPVFDDQGAYSIGCITLDPQNPDTVWVGTGENVSGRHVGFGDGVYRSRDAGMTWENLGLKDSEHIGMIRVHPEESSIVYVAAQGPLWSGGGERGLYRSVDGGTSWAKILGAGEFTGAGEIHLDPRNPQVLYAVLHQRLRSVAALVNGGPESGIHKSTDGGDTWRELTEGLPEEDMGKIGLAVSPVNPDVLYATIELGKRKGGFWRSADGGESWEKRNDYVSGGTGPHYYQEIFADPHNFDRVYQMDNHMQVTHDGGKTFSKVPRNNKHGDNHALVFSDDDPGYLLAGTDGGLYQTWDEGENWKFVANLPVTQFYKVAVDYDEPYYNVYGGTQDNNTQGGPSRTDNISGIRNSDWFITLTGDGHQPASDYSNPDIVYSQWQQGNLTRFDRRTGEVVYIQPQPAANEPWDRFNWDAPILVSPHDPATLFHASQRVWRSDDRGDSWRTLSGDLTRALEPFEMPLMGRLQSVDAAWDRYAMSKFGTITSFSQSPLNEDLLFVGTDDGLIQISEDGGVNWRRIDKLPGVPEFFFVNDIKADLHDENTVYVVVDDHKKGDFSPYILKSSDRGRRWRSIAGDLPERHIVWRVVQDHVKPGLLFAGTEFGVFFTVDGGGRWVKLTGGTPTIPFRDLAIQKRENDLVGATFGRGFFVLDDYSPLREVSEQMLAREFVLFDVRDPYWYVEKRPLGRGVRGSSGDDLYVAPNPPFGATFTYYLRDEIRTAGDARRESEKPLEAQGRDTPWPGWDALLAEDLEPDPAILLTVYDSDGAVVRTLSGPLTAGFHRVTWDLRYPSLEPWEEKPEEQWVQPLGVLAPPGQYEVRVARLVDGKSTPLGDSRSFELLSIREPTLAEGDPAEASAFARDVDEMARAAEGAVVTLKELLKSAGAIRAALLRSSAPPALLEETLALARRASELKDRLAGNERREVSNDPGPVSIQRRLTVAGYNKYASASGPTATQRESAAIATRQMAALKRDLNRLVETDFEQLQQRLEAAGVPWTPGRGAPLLQAR